MVALWSLAVAFVPAIAWLLLKGENDSPDQKGCVTKPVRGRRHFLDTAAQRRVAREEFYRDFKNFDYNCPPHSDLDKGLNVEEKYVLNSKGKEIFLKSWAPAHKPLYGVIFLCHGYGDTVTYFLEGVARTLALAGYAVHGMDYPGFGMSEGLHGYIPDFHALVDDVIEQYRAIKEREELKGLPCFLYGESMGGAVALRAHLKEPSLWNGAVLVAPMCKIADTMYPPWIQLQILLLLARIIPKAKLVPDRNIAALGFRVPEKRHLADMNPISYSGNPRLGTAVQLLRITDYIESKLHEVSLPLLVLHGGDDRVTDLSISRLLHEKARSKDKTLRVCPDSWHCIMQGEPDDVIRKVMREVIEWLDARAAPKLWKLGQSEEEFEERVAAAVPHLINFGRLNVAT